MFAETCPQYLFLTADDLDKDAMEGAKFCCSPPPRDQASQEAMWRGTANGTFQVVSSDHAPFRFDKSGKLIFTAPTRHSKKIPNGIPGLEVRCRCCFRKACKQAGSISIGLSMLPLLDPAKLFGLFPQKGTIAPGSDADLAIWDPNKDVAIRRENLHDNVGYTPYEGRKLKGWPITVISRGRVVSSGRTASR